MKTSSLRLKKTLGCLLLLTPFLQANADTTVENTIREPSQEVQKCINPTSSEYWDLILATATDQTDILNILTKTFCFDLNSYDFSRIGQPHPVFYSTRPTVLNYYMNTNRNFIYLKHNDTDLDILSHILTLPYGPYDSSSVDMKNKILQKLYKYNRDITPEIFNNPLQTLDNHKEKYSDDKVWNNHLQLIELAARYYENIIALPEDKNGNTALFFSVLANQPELFEASNVNNYYNYYKKNNDGYTLFHLAFAKDIYIGSEEDKVKNKKIINEHLMKQFTPDRIAFLDLPDITFLEFIKLLKDNNTDLYNSIVEKQKTINLDIDMDDINVDRLKEMDYDKHLSNLMNKYILEIE